MYVPFNPNPCGKRTSDCVVRAVSKILDMPWEKTYMELCVQGLKMCDWGNSNAVWGAYLLEHGFRRDTVQNTCPDCYTIDDFCAEHPTGEYILATGSHVVAVIDGNYYDSWDSGYEVPVYAYKKE